MIFHFPSEAPCLLTQPLKDVLGSFCYFR